MAAYMIICHHCDRAPYVVESDTIPTKCQICGSENIDVMQLDEA